MPKIGFGSTLSSSRIRTRQLACESSQKTSSQVNAVTKTAIAHDPMPHASPTTTTVIAFPVSFGLSSSVRNRRSAPMPKITKASVELVPLSSATTAPTMPRMMSALRSSKSESGFISEERRGCHAIAHAQPTARLRLRKSRRMNSGCPNCWILCWIDSSSGPRLGHLCDRVGAECCRRQHAYKGNHGDGRDCAQRPSKMAIKAKKMSLHSLPVPYQNQIPSRPGCRVGVSLPSLYSYGFSPRTLTGLKGINPGGNDVLACRQVPIVVSALRKAPHVLSVDRQDKAKIAPKICDPSNDQMT